MITPLSRNMLQATHYDVPMSPVIQLERWDINILGIYDNMDRVSRMTLQIVKFEFENKDELKS